MKKQALIITVIFLLSTFLFCGGKTENENQTVSGEQKSPEIPADSGISGDSMIELTKETVEQMYDRIVIAKAPPFTLFDLNKTKLTLNDYDNYVLIVNFFSMYSTESKRFLPTLSFIHNNFRDKRFSVLGVCIDQDAVSNLKNFAEINQIPYPILYSLDGRVIKNYGVTTTPHSFLIDKKGNIVGQFVGGRNQQKIEQIIELFL
jgi:peroxiredoxin